MRLSGTVMEIWRLKDKGVTTLTFWGHVTSSVTWPFDSRPAVDFLWVVHCDHWPCVHLAQLWRYGRLKFFQEDVGRWSVGRFLILHWFHILFFATLGT